MKHHKPKKRAEIKKGICGMSEDFALGIIMNKTKTNETIERELIMKLLK